VIEKVMDTYQPGVVVLQCGADSLTGDRLGCFNLTLKGHGACVDYVKSFGVPMLVLGGGGYNIRNVSRCWTFETSVLLDYPISNNIPHNDFLQYYAPSFRLHLTPDDNMSNSNTKEDLEQTKIAVLQQLSELDHAPSVQMQQVPPDMYLMDLMEERNDNEKDASVDARFTQRDEDMHVEKEGEFFDDESDQDYKETKTSFRGIQTKPIFGTSISSFSSFSNSSTSTTSITSLTSTISYPRNRKEREQEIRDRERDVD